MINVPDNNTLGLWLRKRSARAIPEHINDAVWQQG